CFGTNSLPLCFPGIFFLQAVEYGFLFRFGCLLLFGFACFNFNLWGMQELIQPFFPLTRRFGNFCFSHSLTKLMCCYERFKRSLATTSELMRSGYQWRRNLYCSV